MGMRQVKAEHVASACGTRRDAHGAQGSTGWTGGDTSRTCACLGRMQTLVDDGEAGGRLERCKNVDSRAQKEWCGVTRRGEDMADGVVWVDVAMVWREVPNLHAMHTESYQGYRSLVRFRSATVDDGGGCCCHEETRRGQDWPRAWKRMRAVGDATRIAYQHAEGQWQIREAVASEDSIGVPGVASTSVGHTQASTSTVVVPGK